MRFWLMFSSSESRAGVVVLTRGSISICCTAHASQQPNGQEIVQPAPGTLHALVCVHWVTISWALAMRCHAAFIARPPGINGLPNS